MRSDHLRLAQPVWPFSGLVVAGTSSLVAWPLASPVTHRYSVMKIFLTAALSWSILAWIPDPSLKFWRLV